VSSWLQFTLICLASATAAFVGGRFLPASLSSRLRKQLSQQSVDIEQLASDVARLTNLIRTVSNRIAVGQHKAKKSGEVPLEADAAPPPGASKAEVRKFYGLPDDPRGFIARQRELDKHRA